MPFLFAYGTLQQENVQLSTFGRRLDGRSDELVGYERSLAKIDNPEFVATSGKAHHANVTFNGRDDSRVSGTVFEITDAELAAADEYERLAAYTRKRVPLASGKRAWVYVHAGSAPPHSFVEIPALGSHDVAVVQSLLESAGFFFHIQEGFGESPAVILIREEDVAEIKQFLSAYRIRNPADKKMPIPW